MYIDIVFLLLQNYHIFNNGVYVCVKLQDRSKGWPDNDTRAE